MNLLFLGTGAAFATKYKNTSFIIDNDKEYFLVDGMGGSSILKAFKENDLDWRKLRYAYLSHKHTDHLLGMIWVIRYISSLMLGNKYDGDFYLYLHEELREKIITICNCVLNPKECNLLNTRIKLVVVEDNESKMIMNMKFTFFDIHSTKAKQYGFRVDYNDNNFVFCGDEPISKFNEQYIRNTDLLLLEAYCLEKDREYYHPKKIHHNTVKMSAESAERLNVKKLVLYHTEDETTYLNRTKLYLKEARTYYRNEVVIPLDNEKMILK